MDMTPAGLPVQVSLFFGTTTSCTAGVHRSMNQNSRVCDISGTCASMSFASNTNLTNSFKPPVCPGASALSGTLAPTGQKTVCCM